MTSGVVASDLRRIQNRLEPGDPARPMLELAATEDDPVLLAAIVRRLVAEIRLERDGPRAVPAGDSSEKAHASNTTA